MTLTLWIPLTQKLTATPQCYLSSTGNKAPTM